MSQCFYWFLQVPEAGVETSRFEQGKTALSENGGTPGGTLGPDSDLQTIIDAWPVLDDRTRGKILRDVQRALK
ncbi:MAG: hypothetical protein NTX48_08085 [Planctomycetales bacterium]|nr:hypothetical protein [Planctomycetales bacterium]